METRSTRKGSAPVEAIIAACVILAAATMASVACEYGLQTVRTGRTRAEVAAIDQGLERYIHSRDHPAANADAGSAAREDETLRQLRSWGVPDRPAPRRREKSPDLGIDGMLSLRG